MNCLNIDRIAPSDRSLYAGDEDFRKLFARDVKSLYLLSFLLTASHGKAERCFLVGLDECLSGLPVFQKWADSWARRAIVRCAVRMMAPHADSARLAPDTFHSTHAGGVPGTALNDARFARVLALEDFERFVYVLSVLEGYPDQSCAIFLQTSQQEVVEARVRALEHTADFDKRNCGDGLFSSRG